MRALHLLSQKPSVTGSGVTFEALIRHAGEAGWTQQAVFGRSAGDPPPRPIRGLSADSLRPLVFGEGELDFDLPGMSDTMPYPSSRWSSLDARQLETYRDAVRRHLRAVAVAARPDVIHAHHLWLMTSLVKDVCPGVPVVAHCHGTDLRQLALCPHLAPEIAAGVGRCERILALHAGQARQIVEALGVAPQRVAVVGAGYDTDLFRPHPECPGAREPGSILYAGKLSAAKGVPWLLDAFEALAARRPNVTLHLAGAGAGPEAEAVRERIRRLAPRVVAQGQLAQTDLARLMRQCEVFVLPSFFEGLPLVLVEALASGCRLVSTALPAVVGELAPHLGAALDLVPLPRLEGPDRPVEADLPGFARRLGAALGAALDAPPLGAPGASGSTTLDRFAWRAVFDRVERHWREVAAAGP